MIEKKILIPLILLTFLLGCSPEGQNTLSQPEKNEAWITFISGDVSIQEPGGDFAPAEMGQSISVNSIIKTGSDSFCDLQIGESALIQIDEKTLLSLDNLYNEDGSLQVLAGMNRGTAVTKVRKLFDEESFEIQTQSTVVGVRGTRFLFSASPETGATLAVTEGSVLIKPVLDDDILSNAADWEESFPLILADQEISVTRELIRLNRELFDNAARENDAEQFRLAASQYGFITPLSRKSRERLIQIRDARLFSTKRSRLPVNYTVQTTVEDASIYINSRYAGKDICSGAAEPGEALAIEVRAPGYKPEVRVVFPQKGADNNYTIEQEADQGKTFTLSLDNTLGEIQVNGVATGKNKISITLKQEETAIITATAPGYIPTIIPIDSQTEQTDITLQLQKELKWMEQISIFPINGILPENPFTTVMDGGGKLKGINSKGEVQWEIQTSNTSVKTFSPVAVGNAAALSGLEELISFNPEDGTVYFRKPLPKGEQHIFGRRPSAHPGGLLFPTDFGYRLLNPESGEEIHSVSVPRGTKMTPLHSEDWTAMVNTRGTVFFYDDEGELLGQIPTSASDVIALTLTLSPDGRYGFIADKNGLVVCINLDKRQQLWSKPLSQDERIPVSENLDLWENTLIIYSRGSLYAMDSRDGTLKYSIEGDFTAPPLVLQGVVYAGKSNGEIVLLKAETGEQLHSIKLDKKLSCRPELHNGLIYIGTETGEIATISPLILPRM